MLVSLYFFFSLIFLENYLQISVLVNSWMSEWFLAVDSIW